MFTPYTNRIEQIAKQYQPTITQLESLLAGIFNTYIDFANVRPWSEKLGWHIDTKRLMQFLKSFDNAGAAKFYIGELVGDKDSKALLNNFIRTALIRRYDVATIEYLNKKFEEMNKQGIYSIEDRKCNFDVEIGRDMLLDHERNQVETFVLWSGDSDFAEPVDQLLADGNKVVLFATARKVSTELNNLQSQGLFIFEIQKIRNFICWKREIDLPKTQKGLPFGSP